MIKQLLNLLGLGSKKYESLSADEFMERLKTDKNAVIIDVRTPDEFRGGHLPKAVNMNIMSSAFRNKMGELSKEKTLYVYCRSGARSGNACRMLAANGFTGIINMSGGLMRYNGKLAR